jgi:hypothetical protein
MTDKLKKTLVLFSVQLDFKTTSNDSLRREEIQRRRVNCFHGATSKSGYRAQFQVKSKCLPIFVVLSAGTRRTLPFETMCKARFLFTRLFGISKIGFRPTVCTFPDGQETSETGY